MLLLALLAMTLSPSIPPAQPDAAQLRRALERLEPGARVLYVAAHPDDENTRLIAWLVHVKKARVAYLSITRGDGGQNLIGQDLGPALGALRTQELLAARRIDGAEQLFTRARDFGYSKNPEEALRFWGHDRVLEDVVFAYRSFRPDVVVTRFDPKPSETHGHHTASAQLAVQAFTAAADPKFAPEQLRLVKPWQPRRVVWNAGWFQSKPPDDLHEFTKEETGTYDALLGLSMSELAADSRTMHKSQGFGANRDPGSRPEYFFLLAGEPMQHGLLDGVPAPAPSGALARALAAFRPEAPQEAIPALLELYAGAPEERRADIAEAIAACAGLSLQAAADKPAVAPGLQLPLSVSALLRAPAQLALASVELSSGQKLEGPGALKPDAPWTQKAALDKLPPPLSSDPAWLRKAPEEGHYPVEALEDRNRPEPAPPIWADFKLRAGDISITVRRPIVFRWVDPVLGQRSRAVEIAPPATIDAAAAVLLFPDAAERTLRVIVRSAAGPVQGSALVEAPAGFAAEPRSRPFKLEAAGSEQELLFTLRAEPSSKEGTLRLGVKVDGKRFDRGVRRVEYAHVPPQVWHPESSVRLVHLDLQRGPSRIGYVMGPGDEVSQVLSQAGYSVTPLDQAALRERDLSSFDAIVIGVRAYNVHPWLQQLKPRLMQYVEQGGVLLVQYMTNNWFNKAPDQIGPYPFTVTRDRVTDETAEVSFATPASAVLNAPNQITAADFAGWVQERGLYYAGQASDRYEQPLSMHDPGEAPLRGSLLIGRYGKGRFIYTGLAFFRQLPAGVPGALRLFANLLARDADATH